METVERIKNEIDGLVLLSNKINKIIEEFKIKFERRGEFLEVEMCPFTSNISIALKDDVNDKMFCTSFKFTVKVDLDSNILCIEDKKQYINIDRRIEDYEKINDVELSLSERQSLELDFIRDTSRMMLVYADMISYFLDDERSSIICEFTKKQKDNRRIVSEYKEYVLNNIKDAIVAKKEYSIFGDVYTNITRSTIHVNGEKPSLKDYKLNDKIKMEYFCNEFGENGQFVLNNLNVY